MIVYLKKSNRIVSAGALLAFVAIVLVVVNFLVLNDASMKLLPETVISDRRFLPDLSMKRLSRRLSQEKEPPQDKKVPSSDKNVPSSDTKVPSSDIKIPSSDTKVPPSDTKEPSSDSKVPPSDTKVPSSYKKDPPQDISVPFCTWKDSNTTIGDNLVNQTTEARHFHNFSQVFEELQYLPLCPQYSPLLRGRTEVYQGNITWEQAQVNKTVRCSPLVQMYCVKCCLGRVLSSVLPSEPFLDRQSESVFLQPLTLYNMYRCFIMEGIIFHQVARQGVEWLFWFPIETERSISYFSLTTFIPF